MLGRFLCRQFDDCSVTTLGLDTDNDISCDLSQTVPHLENRFETIIHAAGSTLETDAMSVNLTGTQNLCKALESKPPHYFIFISSLQVYGCSCGENLDENTVTAPTTQYGKSKLQAEEYLKQWCQAHNVTLSILRPAMIMGTGMKGSLRSMVNGINSGYYFHIKDNNARRSIVHALDVAKASRLIAPIGGTYNLTDNIHPSVHQLAEAVAKRIGGKRIYTLPRRLVNILAKIGNLMGNHAPISTKRLEQLTQTLTFSSNAIAKVIDWNPLNVAEYISTHQYTDNDI